MINAAIYARVSTDHQAEHGYSIETQIAACKQYADKIGATSVVNYVDDGYSGAYLERPRLDALREALRARIYDAVIVYTPDRLARRLAHQLLITEEIEKAGATLHFINGEYKQTPEGQLFFQMQGAFSEYEREKIRERTMRGMRGKLRSGKPISNHNVFGYDWDSEAENYVINPAQSKIVQMIFDMYVNGIGGTEVIATKLTSMNIPKAKSGMRWYSSYIAKMLKNEMYVGEYFAYRIWHKKTNANHTARICRPESEWIPMKCPAIVSREVFDAAQHLLATNKNRQKHIVSKQNYLLQGMMKCAKCGHTVVIVNSMDRRYYICHANSRKALYENPCNARYAITYIVDDAFWSSLKQICSSKKSISEYIKQTEHGKRKIADHDDTKKLKSRLKQIDKEKSVVMEWFTNGLIKQDAATEKLSALTQEEKRIEKKLKKPNATSKTINVKKIYEAVNNCGEDFVEKRNVIRSLIDYIEYERTDDRKKSLNYGLRFLIHFL